MELSAGRSSVGMGLPPSAEPESRSEGTTCASSLLIWEGSICVETGVQLSP